MVWEHPKRGRMEVDLGSGNRGKTDEGGGGFSFRETTVLLLS